MKHLCGDRSESVPRPQRAQHAHERARRRPQAAAPPPSRRRSAHGARSARIFLGRRLRIAFSCGIRGKPGSQLRLQGTRVRVGCKQTMARAGLVRAYTWRAQRPQIFEEELFKGVPATLRRSSVSMEQPRERTCSERTTATEAQVKAASCVGKRQGETVCRCGCGCGCMVECVGRQAG